jgi:hypothetical protein
MPGYTAIVTLLAIAFSFVLATRAAAAHGAYNVPVPAAAGNPERVDGSRPFDLASSADIGASAR